ncbi:MULTISPECIES: SGNH/GDSL hydrolase family protein [Acidobacteriaceae]|uniref:SGNH/GDSL hydrolase family protein n=1 Tax=Acidobacteriaceae TaxID=204434 RepID=UPI00131E9FA1|nr:MULTISPECIES: SGNH/GDSL hydrolase family protein [Acidobacteriaceae]MDW5265885.1 SGNH/GDSL hydrolase family protein [Edaphobacter sp.]
MKMLARTLLLACVPFVTANVFAQTTVVAAPAVDNATAKQIADMQAKLKDWPNLARYRDENAALAPVAAGEQRVVFYGDSITDGWGRRPETGTFFPGKPYINRGISGQTTPQMVVRFRQDVIDLHPAVVLILAGTNDVAGNTGPMTPEMTEDNFSSMADLAHANGIKVILASITPAFDYPWKRGMEPAPKIRAINAWLKNYCGQHGYTYLDYYTSLTDSEGGMKPGISFDGVHPNAKGYAIMAPLAQAAIDKALETK